MGLLIPIITFLHNLLVLIGKSCGSITSGKFKVDTLKTGLKNNWQKNNAFMTLTMFIL